jgi:hypothetical protein
MGQICQSYDVNNIFSKWEFDTDPDDDGTLG